LGRPDRMEGLSHELTELAIYQSPVYINCLGQD